MTLYETHRNFDLELDKSTGISSYPSFLPEEKDYFINTSIERIIKTKYSGLNIQKTGFQQTQKRSDDLRTVVKTIEYPIALFDENKEYFLGDIVLREGSLYRCNGSNIEGDVIMYPFGLGMHLGYWTKITLEPNRFDFEYPSDYMIGLGEYVNISIISEFDGIETIVKTTRTDVIESTIENINSKLSNTLSEHILHNGKAKPIRLYSDDKIYLYTDGSYCITLYGVTYIKNTEKLNYYLYPEFSSDGTYEKGSNVRHNGHHYICISDYQDGLPWDDRNFEEIKLTIMPDHMWDEIIVGAVRLALENISESRHQTYSQESQLVE